MQEFVRFALLGLGLGSLYSLASQGLIVIYRGSGVLNFAHGAIGMIGAYVEWEVRVEHGQPVGGGVGGRPCSPVPSSVRWCICSSCATSGGRHRWPASWPRSVCSSWCRPSPCSGTAPRSPSSPPNCRPTCGRSGGSRSRSTGSSCWGSPPCSAPRCGPSTGTPSSGSPPPPSRRTSGRRPPSACRPDFLATINWALGSALAGVAAILIAPIVQLQVATMTNLVLAALATALVAGFRSFPIAFAAGMLIGIGQTELTRYVSTPGIATSLPFAVIVLWMILRGQALPLRDYFLQRLPAVGTGRTHPLALVVAVVVTVLIILWVPLQWQDAFVTTFAVGLVLLSLVVITGYAGQLSLGQFALAGFGAWVAGRLVDAAGWPFLLALLAGCVLTIPVGVLFALPAVRARGINLAIVTLGLGSAIELMIFNNGDFVGGFAGTRHRQAEPVRVGHQRHHPPRPLRHRVHGVLRGGRADGRQHAAGPVRSAPPGRADQRTGRGRARDQRARSEDLRLCGFGRHRRDRRHPAGVPQGRHPLRLGVHELHVDPGRRLVVHRRHRLPRRPGLRVDPRAGLARSAADQRDLRQPDEVHPAHRRWAPDPARAAEPGRHRQGVGQPDRLAGPEAEGQVPQAPPAQAGDVRAAGGATGAGGAEDPRGAGTAGALRRGHGRGGRVVQRHPRAHRRPHRPERRRQDVGDRRRHRVHPGRRRQCPPRR